MTGPSLPNHSPQPPVPAPRADEFCSSELCPSESQPVTAGCPSEDSLSIEAWPVWALKAPWQRDWRGFRKRPLEGRGQPWGSAPEGLGVNTHPSPPTILSPGGPHRPTQPGVRERVAPAGGPGAEGGGDVAEELRAPATLEAASGRAGCQPCTRKHCRAWAAQGSSPSTELGRDMAVP